MGILESEKGKDEWGKIKANGEENKRQNVVVAFNPVGDNLYMLQGPWFMQNSLAFFIQGHVSYG